MPPISDAGYAPRNPRPGNATCSATAGRRIIGPRRSTASRPTCGSISGATTSMSALCPAIASPSGTTTALVKPAPASLPRSAASGRSRSAACTCARSSCWRLKRSVDLAALGVLRRGRGRLVESGRGVQVDEARIDRQTRAFDALHIARRVGSIVDRDDLAAANHDGALLDRRTRHHDDAGTDNRVAGHHHRLGRRQPCCRDQRRRHQPTCA